MDKLNKLLLGAVCLSVIVNATVLLTMWVPGQEPIPASQTVLLGQIEEERQWANIAINQEMQVINGSGEDIWIKVIVDTPEINGKKAFRLLSDTIEEETESNSRGAWLRESEGCYYYNQTVKSGEQTVPLFYGIKEIQGDICYIPEGDKVKVKAQAIQVNWLSPNISTSQEAFASFTAAPLEEQVAQLI